MGADGRPAHPASRGRRTARKIDSRRWQEDAVRRRPSTQHGERRQVLAHVPGRGGRLRREERHRRTLADRRGVRRRTAARRLVGIASSLDRPQGRECHQHRMGDRILVRFLLGRLSRARRDGLSGDGPWRDVRARSVLHGPELDGEPQVRPAVRRRGRRAACSPPTLRDSLGVTSAAWRALKERCACVPAFPYGNTISESGRPDVHTRAKIPPLPPHGRGNRSMP